MENGAGKEHERLNLPNASSWARYEKCPGSFQLEAEARKLNQLAHEVKSPEALRGTLIHSWLAGEVDEDGNPIALNESEATTAEFLLQRMSDQRVRVFGDQKVEQLVEKRLWLTLNGQKVLSGRFDRVIYTPEIALLQDAKTGFSEPDPAEQNAQLKVLAVLVALHMPPTLKEVVVQVISGPFGVSEGRYDLPALARAYNDILATLRSLHAVDAPLKPSPAACQWCVAVNVCQAVKNLILPVATKTQVSQLPEGERGSRLLDEIEVIQGHLETIKEYYANRLTEDPAYKLPGYEMVPGAVRREVTDWEAARMRLGQYLDTDDIKGAANYRLGELEKALGKKLKLKNAALKARMGEILHGLIEEKQNAASLKRMSGKARLVEVQLP